MDSCIGKKESSLVFCIIFLVAHVSYSSTSIVASYSYDSTLSLSRGVQLLATRVYIISMTAALLT